MGNLLRHCWVSLVLCITLLVPSTDPVYLSYLGDITEVPAEHLPM